MAISLETINVGVENQASGSDSLYVAFTKTRNNFATLSSLASQYTNFVASNGIGITSNPTTGTVTVTNTGIVSIVAGTGLTSVVSNGVVTLSVTGNGTGNLVAGVTSVALSSNTLAVSGSPIISAGTLNVDLPIIPLSANFAPGQYTAPQLTVDSFGRITTISNSTSTGTVTSVNMVANSAGISITGGPITSSGIFYIENTGVTKLNAGPGIGLSSDTGVITIYYDNPTGGTVTRVGVTSSTLNVTNSPVTTYGDIGIELPSNISLTKLTSNDVVSSNLITANTITANVIQGANTVTANYFIGDGGFLSNVSPVRRAESANTVTSNAQPNITSVGTLSSLSTTGNITAGGNLILTGNLSSTSGNVTVGNLSSTGRMTTTGNATVGNLITSGTITATGNITGGNISTGGRLTVTSNIAGGNISTNGNLTVVGSASLGNLGVSGTSSLTGNLLAGNVSISGSLNIAGNTTLSNLSTTGSVTSNGDLSALNTTVTGNLSVTGDASITGNVSGNIANLSNINLTGNLAFDSKSRVYADVSTGALTLFTSNSWVELNYKNDQIIYADTSEVGIQTNALTGGSYWRFGKDGNLVGDGSLTISTGRLTAANLTITNSASIAANANVGNITATGFGNFAGDLSGNNLTSLNSIYAPNGFIVLGTTIPTGTIADGTFAIDSANTRLVVRIGGLWRYITYV